MPHEFERGAEENVRYRRLRASARRRRGTFIGTAGKAKSDALVEHMAHTGAHDRAPDVAGHQEADHCPKNLAFPSHSR